VNRAAKKRKRRLQKGEWRMAGKFQPYRGEKRRKEVARKAKQEEKLRKKLERKEGALGAVEDEPEAELPPAEELPPDTDS
jgi:hypothetical protein